MVRLFWRIPYLSAVCYAVAISLLVSAAYWYVGYRDLFGLYDAYRNGEIETENLQRKLEEDQAKAETLEAHVAGLDTDPVELEAAMRKNKNVVREGEKIYRFELAPERRDRPVASGEDVP
jgi:cell division protein FtsB